MLSLKFECTARLLKSPGLFSVFWLHASNAVVWMESTHPLFSKSSTPFINPFGDCTKAQITIGIIIIFMFHSIFNSAARSRYLSFFSIFFSFTLWSAETGKSTIQVLLIIIGLYDLIIIGSGYLAENR